MDYKPLKHNNSVTVRNRTRLYAALHDAPERIVVSGSYAIKMHRAYRTKMGGYHWKALILSSIVSFAIMRLIGKIPFDFIDTYLFDEYISDLIVFPFIFLAYFLYDRSLEKNYPQLLQRQYHLESIFEQSDQMVFRKGPYQALEGYEAEAVRVLFQHKSFFRRLGLLYRFFQQCPVCEKSYSQAEFNTVNRYLQCGRCDTELVTDSKRAKIYGWLLLVSVVVALICPWATFGIICYYYTVYGLNTTTELLFASLMILATVLIMAIPLVALSRFSRIIRWELYEDH